MTQWVCISDTHCQEKDLVPLSGDVLVHTGDFINYPNDITGTYSFFEWFGRQPHKHKVMVKGNHDPKDLLWLAHIASDNGITFLDHEIVEICGKKVLGLENTSGPLDVKDHVDVLLSHNPPLGILDEIPFYSAFGDDATMSIGSKHLYDLVKRLKPEVHAFGHIHECSGRTFKEGKTTFINACMFVDKKRTKLSPRYRGMTWTT